MTSSDPKNFKFNQTMLRIKDPAISIPFYCDVLGMTLLHRYDYEAMDFSLYFLGYEQELVGEIPPEGPERTKWIFSQTGTLELTHNWGTENDPEFSGYHNGNEDPRGFGHIGISVSDVYAACDRFEELGVEFVKRPDDGSMKGLAFIKDPDGYWIEVLSPEGIAKINHD